MVGIGGQERSGRGISIGVVGATGQVGQVMRTLLEERDFPVYQDTTALALDGNRAEWLDLDLSCVTSHTQAQRLARIAYKRRRYGYQASLNTTFKHFDVTANDVITITDSMAGLSGTTFRVERDTATVGEDYELSVGDGPPRALRARYDLAWEDGRWRIVAGL